MITLQFSVNNQIMTRTDDAKIVSNSRNIHQCHFSFSEEWDEKEISVTFYRGTIASTVLLDEDNNCLIPAELMKTSISSIIKLGVSGYDENEVITSTIVEIPMVGGPSTSAASGQITSELFTQIMQKVSEVKKTKVEPEAIAEAVNEHISNHPFDGIVSEKIAEYIKEHASEFNPGTSSGEGGTQSDFDKFCNNIDIDYEYDSVTNANYTIIRIYKERLDGTKQYPFVYAPNGADACEKSTYEISHEDGWLLAINSGIFNTKTHKADGMLIQNSIVLNNAPTETHPQCRPLTIDSNGDLSEVAYDADANELVNSGVVSAVCGFMAIVKDYKAVSSSNWNSVAHYTQNAQRQIIGQFGNGDYAIITCEGRNTDNSDGWTIEEAQNICIKHGLKFAYNLDGGGSTETMLGQKHFNHIYENSTGRKVPTFIVFNGKNTFKKISHSNETPEGPTPEEPTPEEPTKALTKITASKTVTEFTANTELSVNDVTVIAHYSDGTTSDVTAQSVIDTSNVDMSTEGTYSLGIQYSEDGVTKDTTIQIAVVAEPSTEKAYKWVFGYSVIAYDGYLNQNPYSTRVTCLTDAQNEARVNGIDGNALGYLIPIPSSATKVTVTAPSYITGIALWDSTLKRIVDAGWGTVSVNELTFDANTYAYLSVNVKNSSNTAIDTATDTTEWTIEFS